MFNEYDKTVSVLSYIPLAGWIIALIMNSDKSGEEKSYNAFHLRQGLGLSIISLLYSILNGILFYIPFLGKLANLIIVICFIGIAVIGILNATRGERKFLPFLGKQIEQIFKGAFE
jgi:uncharacterized membrane protein